MGNTNNPNKSGDQILAKPTLYADSQGMNWVAKIYSSGRMCVEDDPQKLKVLSKCLPNTATY